MGELLSHLHPQRLEEAAELHQDAFLRAKDSASNTHPAPISPWPQDLDTKLSEGLGEGLVSKYVEQSVAWAAMIVSRSRSTFVTVHLKQKRMGARNLLRSLHRAFQRRLAGAVGTWRSSSYLTSVAVTWLILAHVTKHLRRSFLSQQALPSRRLSRSKGSCSSGVAQWHRSFT